MLEAHIFFQTVPLYNFLNNNGINDVIGNIVDPDQIFSCFYFICNLWIVTHNKMLFLEK